MMIANQPKWETTRAATIALWALNDRMKKKCLKMTEVMRRAMMRKTHQSPNMNQTIKVLYFLKQAWDAPTRESGHIGQLNTAL